MFEREYESRDRFTVLVEFTIEAETPEDAEEEINNIIMEGILSSQDEDRNIKCEYDITSSEPAEVDV